MDWNSSSDWIGGLIGTVIGLAGGAIGTWCSIRNTSGPRERAFMIRSSAIAWMVVGLFLVALFLVPQPYNWLLFIPYALLLTLAVRRLNSVQSQIRQEEASSRTPPQS